MRRGLRLVLTLGAKARSNVGRYWPLRWWTRWSIPKETITTLVGWATDQSVRVIPPVLEPVWLAWGIVPGWLDTKIFWTVSCLVHVFCFVLRVNPSALTQLYISISPIHHYWENVSACPILSLLNPYSYPSHLYPYQSYMDASPSSNDDSTINVPSLTEVLIINTIPPPPFTYQ